MRPVFFSRRGTPRRLEIMIGDTAGPPAEQPPGSKTEGPDPAAIPAVFTIGHILKPRGIRGEVKVKLLCDGPEHFAQCLAAQQTLVWKPPPPKSRKAPSSKGPSPITGPLSEKPRPVQVDSFRFHGGCALLSLAGVHSIEDAEPFRDCYLGLPADSLPPPEEETYYHHQLEGLRVTDPRGNDLGVVEAVKENPAHDHLVVRPPAAGASTFLLPLVRTIVKRIDLEKGLIEAEIPSGLIKSQQKNSKKR